MTYDTSKETVGNYPLTVCELKLDACSREYGQSYTNLLTYSEEFDNAAWAVINTPVFITGEDLDPVGGYDAYKIRDNDNTGWEYIYQAAASFTVSSTYTASVYIKKDSIPRTTRFPLLRLTFVGSSPEFNDVPVDTSLGLINKGSGSGVNIPQDAGIEEVGDYWRVYVVGKSVDPLNTSCRIDLFPSAGLGSDFTYTTSSIGTTVFWGAQIIESNSKGHYVKTTTSSATGQCTAALAAGLECYNTRETCQDIPNYTKILKTYRFCQPRSNLPKGINMIPCIKGNPALAPIAAPIFGVGDKGKIALSLQDFPHNDRGVDPYVDTRSYDPESQGTYFGKLQSRNHYYLGRAMTVKTGFINNPFSWGDFQDRLYIIDKIEGPNSNGLVKVTGTDLLRVTDDDYARVPTESTGKYVSGLAGSPLTIVVTTGTGAEYGTSGYVQIGKTTYGFTGRTTDTLTGITAGEWGSETSTPEVGDTVQLCKSWTDENVVDIVYELLTGCPCILASNIPYSMGSPEDEWDAEKRNWLSSYNLTTILTEPVGVKTLLEELTEQCQFSLFVDQRSNLIKLITNNPPLGNEDVALLNDNENLLENSINIKDDTKNHSTRISFSYDKINHSEGDDKTNFHTTLLTIDSTRESLYNVSRTKEIKSRWFDDTNASQVSNVSNRINSRFSDPVKRASFTLEAKDSDLWVGDLVDIESRLRQDFDGSNLLSRYQVLSVRDDVNKYHYIAASSQFTGRFAFIADNALAAASPQIDYSNASDTQKQENAFIGYNGANFPDGEPAYKIA